MDPGARSEQPAGRPGVGHGRADDAERAVADVEGVAVLHPPPAIRGDLEAGAHPLLHEPVDHEGGGRVPNPADRCGNLVRLTEARRSAIDVAVDRQAEVERRVLSVLAPEEVDQLVGMLRRVLVDIEPDRS